MFTWNSKAMQFHNQHQADVFPAVSATKRVKSTRYSWQVESTGQVRTGRPNGRVKRTLRAINSTLRSHAVNRQRVQEA